MPAFYDTQKLNRPIYALRCLGQGIALLGRPPLRHFVLLPLLLNLILYTAAFFLTGVFFADFLHWLIPDQLSWLRWLLWPLFGLAFVLTACFSFTLVVNLLAAPFYAKLAERTEQLLTGGALHPPKTHAMLREMGAEARRLGYFLRWALPLAGLSLIPGLNLAAPWLWLGFNAWFLGLEYTAYPLANHGLLFPEAKRLLSQAKLGVLTLGGIVMLGLGVPLLNLVLPQAAVIAATIYLVNARGSASS
jgi:CysZ protein